ncbi:choice-of-anchor Q domain-containing protein [Marivirga sp.]|uniref:choice-of-anchor Q domain-containing protein n=1 Tax=Marivirga sp. TaxID=2018662 RepID=UPI003DA79886
MKPSKLLFTSICFFLITTMVYAQDCGCDHTISPSDGLLVLESSDFDYEPGDVFCFEAGNYDAIRLIGFKGTAENPLIFKNCGGLVDIVATTYSGISFRQSEFIHLTGTGDESEKYGIKISEIKSKGQVGLGVSDLSSDFEIDHLEIANAGFAGISAKTDPKCDRPETWRENYTFKNLHIHDNYIHNSGGEGMYIGATFGYETSALECDGIERFAHLLENVKVHDNLLEDTGWDGMQFSLCQGNVEIYNNTINGYGTKGETAQFDGMGIGGGTGGRIYNNKIIQKEEYAVEGQRGITCISPLSGTIFFNNIIVNPGEYGIWMHIRMTDAVVDLEKSYSFINNTIISPGKASNGMYGRGIYFNTCIPNGGGCRDYIESNFINNLIINPGSDYENSGFWKGAEESFIDFSVKELRDAANKQNNIFARDGESAVDYLVSDVKFRNMDNNDFRLLEGSVAIDVGMDVSDFGVIFDFEKGERPTGEGFDIGAYEYGSVVTTGLLEPINTKKNLISNLYPNPVSDLLTLEIILDRSSKVDVELYSIRGELIKKLNTGNYVAGSHLLKWNIKDIEAEPGQYIMIVKTEKIYDHINVILE